MRYFFSLIMISILSLSFYSCKNERNEYIIAASNPSTSNYAAAVCLKKELESNTHHQFTISKDNQTTKDNIHSIINGKADFGIIQNTIDYNHLGISETDLNQNIRTVMPLYELVVFIIYREEDHKDNLYDLVKGKRIGFGKKEGGDAWLVQEIFSYLGIPDSIYTSVYTDYSENIIGDQIDISCNVTSYNNPRIIKMLKNGENRIFSFEKGSNIDHLGTAINGIGLINTTLSEFIIPKYIYGRYPEQPVLTACSQAVLICNKELDEDITHDIVEDIFKHKSLLVNNNPIYNIISENFNSYKLRFPMHIGVKMFLDRNKPSFLEKYAEVMALIITILALLFGGISSLRNWQKMKKKDRIDIYYRKVIDLDEKIILAKTKQDIDEIEFELFAIRDNAFEQLIKEKLTADESFNIFQSLLEASLRRLKNKQIN